MISAEPELVQHTSTATSSAVSDFVRLRPVADLPQRPRATSLPGVRIEGVRGSNPLSSTLSSTQLRGRFQARNRPSAPRSPRAVGLPAAPGQAALGPAACLYPGGRAWPRPGGSLSGQYGSICQQNSGGLKSPPLQVRLRQYVRPLQGRDRRYHQRQYLSTRRLGLEPVCVRAGQQPRVVIGPVEG
jgi:hypothetical protein